MPHLFNLASTEKSHTFQKIIKEGQYENLEKYTIKNGITSIKCIL